ncbi:1,4-dihydroxy-6-naphthoate synthase [Campylobacter blaseri]|uniref:Menaquinone biosynthetic enzyme MqnA n=1 Tax=Campylobacter blaseri TaxID=2042961 RepID=A0A2P8R3Z4_9BACT|nr:MqnA/MqnD/SBP family protein [Campylobacter blaseri]PSM53220.1 hypothetical protein CQ405_01355 [Campylobacter blaseri]PSM54686.1 hypothetical protein CRN67_01355 [Campylobacter blaseri]QKF86833.1 1,4-dihydroxy-6-naphthoate synthase [Campylobacter blaseri]
MKIVEIASNFYMKFDSSDSEILEFKHIEKNIKYLNKKIFDFAYDISLIDFSLYPLVFEEYALIYSGVKFEKEASGKLIRKKEKRLKPNFKLALEDENSIYAMLLRIKYSEARIITMDEKEIKKAILEDEVHAGLVFNGEFFNDFCVENDINQIWNSLNKKNLPFPVSCFVVRRSLPLVDAIESQRVLENKFQDGKFYENKDKSSAIEFLFELGYKYGFYPQKINIYDNLIPVEYLDFRFS